MCPRLRGREFTGTAVLVECTNLTAHLFTRYTSPGEKFTEPRAGKSTRTIQQQRGGDNTVVVRVNASTERLLKHRPALTKPSRVRWLRPVRVGFIGLGEFTLVCLVDLSVFFRELTQCCADFALEVWI